MAIPDYRGHGKVVQEKKKNTVTPSEDGAVWTSQDLTSHPCSPRSQVPVTLGNEQGHNPV